MADSPFDLRATIVTIRIKRVYEPQDQDDGTRILVDRLWPRGLSKARATVDLWLKEIAPSTALRKWFGHDPSKWDVFKSRYFKELDVNPSIVEQLSDMAKARTVTLLFGARDPEHNQAAALQEYILRRNSSLGIGSRSGTKSTQS